MPNLAFSPVPQQPARQERGGEKENLASTPLAMAGDGGGSMMDSGKSTSRSPSPGSASRSPLEAIVAPAAPVPSNGAGTVICKRSSSCKCPDCNMAASVFGIEQLRQLSGGGGGGGVARSPLTKGSNGMECADKNVTASEPATDVEAAPAGDSLELASAGVVLEDEGVRGVLVEDRTTAAASIGRKGVVGTSAAEATASQGTTVAASGGSKKKAGAGWGFRMARAVFSPLSPKKKEVSGGSNVESGASISALTDELDGGAITASAFAVAAAAAVPQQEPAVEGALPVEESTPAGDDSSGGKTEGVNSGDDLLSDDDPIEEDEDGDEGAAPAAREQGDAATAAVEDAAGDTVVGDKSGDAAENNVIVSAFAGPEPAVVQGEGASRRPSRGRRLSKDVFFECSTEVEHVLTSDSEPDNGKDDDRGNLFAKEQADDPPASDQAASAVAPAAAGGASNSGDVTSVPVTAPTAITPAITAAGGSESTTTAGDSAPAEEGGAAPAAGVDLKTAGSQPQGAAARGVPGGGRRRNRRQAPQLALGMADAYGHEDDRAKFSQAEVDAKIKERLSEERAEFEKTVSALKGAHEAELRSAEEKLQRYSSDGNRAKMAARDAEALEREIAMLSERYGEAAAEAKSNRKVLLEKEALLDAVTAQLMGLKTDLNAARAERAAEKQAMKESMDTERRARSLAEGRLQQLETAYNKLEDSERDKRAAGILKMKQDMQALAHAQFAEANKKHVVLKARLERSEARVKLLEGAGGEKDSKIEAVERKNDELRAQVVSLQKAKAESAESASRRERLLQDEVSSLRDEAKARLAEWEAMVRERDAANNGRDVSQDALARMAIRNTQMKESVADLEGKVKELEGFCTEALDQLDAERAKNAALLAAEN